ncbi:MAG: DegT/DnrJ/EryC1/StrS family aminotransferase [Sporomusaceae bacterium]|nr:DegT/DnrJ/EryC1/StrS family aminotransferase [Sporomusaceae bacterium]
MQKIPLVDLVAQYQSIKLEIQERMNAILDKASFIMGPDVTQFEEEFASYCGIPNCLTVANGTDALLLALKAIGIRPGDYVITVPNTFIASSECITNIGAHPEFVDIDPRTYLMDAEKLEAKIKELIMRKLPIKAVIAVHLYGQPCEMDAIMDVVRRYNLKLLEDSAQAHGAKYKGQPIGSFGDAACFSFYPGKNLGAYGDGGAVITPDNTIAENVSMLRNHGRHRTAKYEHEIEGYNSRLDTIQAAVLSVKLKHLEKWTEQRIANAALYSQLLRDCPDIVVPYVARDARHVYHLYVVRSPKRDALMRKLADNGIACGVHYPIPLHLQPAYRYLGYKPGDFPQAEAACAEIFSLPMYPELTSTQIEYICDTIKLV